MEVSMPQLSWQSPTHSALEESTQASSSAAGTSGHWRPYVGLFHLAPVGFVVILSVAFLSLAYRGWPPPDRLGFLLGAVVLTQMAISLHNDYCDRDLDA